MFELSGKVALVTGAGRNIGAGIARLLAAQGAAVAVNDYHLERAESTARRIEDAGGVAIPIAFDVTDLAAVRTAVTEINGKLGPIDILVNNAGTGGANEQMIMAPFAKIDPEYWDVIVGVNLYGVFNCCKAVLDGMIERGWGRIITVASGAGETGLNIGVSPYAAAKAGAIGFMRHLAMENAPFGVTCNTISMGLCVDEPTAVRQLAESIPVKRMGRPEDPGYLAVYLASPEASFITGQSIGMNGGSLMK
jgi:3-oxoacyl-[acyl-carrier protein] reductase